MKICQGQFNVSYGKYQNPDFVNAEGIRAVSQYFNAANIYFTSMDFAEVIKNLPLGAFVYLDPPYDPVSGNRQISLAIPVNGFTKDDHIRHETMLCELTAREIWFSSPIPIRLHSSAVCWIQYHRGFSKAGNQLQPVIAGGMLPELVIRNYSS